MKFQNTILQANIGSQSAKNTCVDAVYIYYIDKVEKSITRTVLEIEKRSKWGRISSENG